MLTDVPGLTRRDRRLLKHIKISPSYHWLLQFFPSSTIPNMSSFQPHPTRFVNGDRSVDDSVTQFAQHSKPSGYWSASQVEVGVSWLFPD